MENRANVLKNKLEPFKFDIFLNNPVTSCPQCTLCDEVNQNKKNEPWFKIFCYQFVRNLETAEITNSTLSEDKKESRCRSLMYWMYSKVKNLYEISNINNKDNIIQELLGVWKKFNDSNVKSYLSSKCSVPNYSEFTDIKEMEKKKIMSDYCENYHELTKILKIYETYVDAHIYYDYFRDSLKTYRKIVGECNTEDFIIRDCSKFCSNDDPDNLLKTAKFRTIEISPGNNDYIEKGKCDILKDEAVAAKTCETKDVPSPEFTFSDKRAIILILFSLWGVFLTFLFLYKLGKKKIIKDSFNEQSDGETLDADYESRDRNMENTGYNIIYNSDWNFSR
ncbi:PIR Superfamily Protein [Plasmodium ovale wallikeri]|uniref:PIR Superfamily Protein n=1 Tax=Plasmodium ovale wallikeri TaxID=864142 RepID=A0A1A9ACC9_PLAOA|nr:PIR Superfamily Protein [Plasmodium ovale wallikeri]